MIKETAFHVEVRITINDPDVIERVTGPGGDEWRSQLYNLYTEKDVLDHLAYNCIANGEQNASRLDGWADLPKEAVEMEIREVDQGFAGNWIAAKP